MREPGRFAYTRAGRMAMDQRTHERIAAHLCGKPVELSVKAILAGREISNREALANPQVLDEFERIREQLLQRHASEALSTRRTQA